MLKKKIVKCNLCGSERYKKLTTCKIEKRDADLPIGEMDIARCFGCGLVYVNPRVEYSESELEKLYSDEYFDADYMRFYRDGTGYQTNEPFDLRMEWIGKYKAPGRILDIGCASGGFLRFAREKGWDTYGVELSRTASETARREHNLNVMTGSLYEARFNDGFFDAVMAGDVLEHVEDPGSFLKEINRIMKKGAVLYIGVPDFDGLYYTAALFLSRFNRKNYFVLPHHIYFFNRRSIARLLECARFKLLDCRKSETNISTKDLTGKIMAALFMIARLFNRQDRILFLAEKG
jgi:2-polyprenyl-3-methyl-5-hydroxy-6-metoxy-1,4-benzoquinol methylase